MTAVAAVPRGTRRATGRRVLAALTASIRVRPSSPVCRVLPWVISPTPLTSPTPPPAWLTRHLQRALDWSPGRTLGLLRDYSGNTEGIDEQAGATRTRRATLGRIAGRPGRRAWVGVDAGSPCRPAPGLRLPPGLWRTADGRTCGSARRPVARGPGAPAGADATVSPAPPLCLH